MFGDDPSHIFTIEIVDTENVSTLKELVKDKKEQAFSFALGPHSVNTIYVGLPSINNSLPPSCGIQMHTIIVTINCRHLSSENVRKK